MSSIKKNLRLVVGNVLRFLLWNNVFYVSEYKFSKVLENSIFKLGKVQARQGLIRIRQRTRLYKRGWVLDNNIWIKRLYIKVYYRVIR